MAITAARVKISPPTEPVVPGRGFYQLEEDALYVQVGPLSKERCFFNWLESDSVSLEFDREGRLMFVEVRRPRRHWLVEEKISRPRTAEVADLRWLDFRERFDSPTLLTNERRTCLQLRFSDAQPSRSYYLGDQVIMQMAGEDFPVALWVPDIVDDMGGHMMSEFRKALR